MISVNSDNVTSLKQFDASLRAAMQSIGFKASSKQGRLFLKKINEETRGAIVCGLSGSVITNCLVFPMVGVINDRVEAMHRQAQSAVSYPEWMKKSVMELNLTIQTGLYRLLPNEELDRDFIKGMYEDDKDHSRWAFNREDALDPILSHLKKMIETYALPFMESLTDCQKIYEAYTTGRVWLSPVERTTKCDNPFVLFLSGRMDEAYEIVEKRIEQNVRFLDRPRQNSIMSDDGRVATIVPSKEMMNLEVQYDRAVLHNFDKLSGN